MDSMMQSGLVHTPAATNPLPLPCWREALEICGISSLREELFLSDIQSASGLGDVRHVKFDYGGRSISGRCELYVPTEDIALLISNFDLQDDRSYVTGQEAQLRLRLSKAGRWSFSSAKNKFFSRTGAYCTMILGPADRPATVTLHKGLHRSVEIVLAPHVLSTLYEGGAEELPDSVKTLVTNKLQEHYASDIRLPSSLISCVDDLLKSEIVGVTRRLFLRAKLIELLCCSFDGLNSIGSSERQSSSPAALRGVERAQKVLLQRFVDPPTLESLAHEVGLSRTALCNSFRQVTGQTVNEYIADLRMQKAIQMLSHGCSSVTQIAFDLGYGHVSSFSNAVQKRFGMSPKVLRDSFQVVSEHGECP